VNVVAARIDNEFPVRIPDADREYVGVALGDGPDKRRGRRGLLVALRGQRAFDRDRLTRRLTLRGCGGVRVGKKIEVPGNEQDAQEQANQPKADTVHVS
jgi:hypothetical protein